MRKVKKIFFVFLLLLVCNFLFNTETIFAHQPRLVDDVNEVVEIQNPTISKAYYGELGGELSLYTMDIAEPSEIYFGLLVPDLPGIDTDYSLEIRNAKVGGGQSDFVPIVLDGLEHEWTPFYEEFGGDRYLQGPERKIMLRAGSYILSVYSPDNRGKYVLAVGDIESFPLNEIINTISVLPQIKQDFFGKSASSAFLNKVGAYLLGFVAMVLLGAYLLIRIIGFFLKRRARTKKTNISENETPDVS